MIDHVTDRTRKLVLYPNFDPNDFNRSFPCTCTQNQNSEGRPVEMALEEGCKTVAFGIKLAR